MITKQLKTVNPCLMKTRYATSAATIRSMVSGSIRLSLGLDQQWLLSPSVTESKPIPNSMAAVVHPRVRQIREETARMEVNKMNRLATKMSMKIRIKPRKIPAIKFSTAFFIVPWITWTRVVKSFICLSLLPVFDWIVEWADHQCYWGVSWSMTVTQLVCSLTQSGATTQSAVSVKDYISNEK